MERKVLVVCSVVGVLGLLTAATGFAAEGTRIKPEQVHYITAFTCVFPRSPALGLGLTAALSLLVAQLTVSISSGCLCCMKGPWPSPSKRRTAVICFVISWFTFAIAFVLLLSAAAVNNEHNDRSVYFSNYNCYVLKAGVFSVATIMSIISLVLGITYYLALNSAKHDQNAWGNSSILPTQGNIALGQPQFPPPQRMSDPVFVHEDTYARRQFA